MTGRRFRFAGGVVPDLVLPAGHEGEVMAELEAHVAEHLGVGYDQVFAETAPAGAGVFMVSQRGQPVATTEEDVA